MSITIARRMLFWTGVGMLWSNLAVRCLAQERFEYTQPEMGLPFRIVLYGPDRATADAAAAAAFGRVKELNDIMSDYDAESELGRLSRSSGEGRWVKVSADLWKVLQLSRALSERSGGKFDVTVGPCVNLWRKARREGRLPDPERLAKAQRSVGFQKMLLDPENHAVKLVAPEMRIDLGAIAKGYAVDEALAVLTSRGIHQALVAGGGDMAVGDPPPAKKGWRVKLQPLDTTNAPPAKYVLLARCGLGTSGDAFQKLEINGKRYSHIIDPFTGIGLTDHSLVTVIGPDCFTADPLATTVSVLGPEAGVRLVEATPGMVVRVVREPEERIQLYESKGFARYYEPE